jgi:nicotinamide riboside kinase
MESYFAGVRKITIVGPESSGKTTLSKALAEHYDAPWVEECARGYLENQGGRYEEKDLEAIAGLQHDIEIGEEKRAWDRHMERYKVLSNGYDPTEAPKAVRYPELPLIICDTDMITVRIWSEEKYGRCDERILKRCREWPYDHWLLCRPDIPWEPDPMRENPHDRDRLFEVYQRTLTEMGKPFMVIEGTHEQRMRKATALVDVLIESDPVKERWI